MNRLPFLLALGLISLGCNSAEPPAPIPPPPAKTDDSVQHLQAVADDRPNVILFIIDDASYNGQARMPTLRQLAKDGLVFSHFYLTASSGSPSRSSIVTGRYPHNTGKAAELHLPISANLPWFPGVLKAHGYYTVLSGKNQMAVGETPVGTKPSRLNDAWHHTSHGNEPGNTGGHAHWVEEVRNRPRNKPFFFWFASTDAHRPWNGDAEWNAGLYGPKHRPKDVQVPLFLVDNLATREDIASHYNEITRFDFFVGEVVKELKAQGVFENTLIMVMSDNGRPFPRSKTRLYDAGIQSFFLVHWPRGIKRADTFSFLQSGCDSLISAIDIAPTVLEVAQITPPPTFQGVSFVPILKDQEVTVREVAFAEQNWHDYEAHSRCIRHKNFLLIQNFRPKLRCQGPTDSVRSPSHRALQAVKNGWINAVQKDIFYTPRPEFEFYAKGQQMFLTGHNEKWYRNWFDSAVKTLDKWMEETGDSVPQNLSQDLYDRETGERLKDVQNFRGTTPGEENNADQINRPGPRFLIETSED